MIYLLIALLLLSFIYRFDIKGKTANKYFCYHTILIILTLVAGLRYRLGVDTTAYLQSFYHDIPYLWDLTLDDLSITSEPLWILLNSTVRSFGGRWYVVQLIQAAFINILVFRYFEKHSKYIFTCALFYFVWMYHFYTMEEMRASISVAICLYSYDYFLNRDWKQGYALMLIACLFHRSSFPLLITPLLIPLLRSNVACLIFLILAFVGSFIIKSGLSDYLSLIELADGIGDIENQMTYYATSDQYGENNHSINFYIGQIFPYLFASIVALFYDTSRNNEPEKIKPIYILGIACILIECNIYIFYRYVHFYACYIIIYVSNLVIGLVKCKCKKISILGINFTKALLITLLFLLPELKKAYDSHEFFPYSSVFEQRIDAKREKIYCRLGYPPPKQNEY